MTDDEQLQIRIHGDESKPTLIYLPGIHGDWLLARSFRERMKPHVRFVDFIYPRTLTWNLDDYADAVLNSLRENGIHEGILLGESFGSQIAWPMIAKCTEVRNSCRPNELSGDRNVATPFIPTALILSGGFIRFPFKPLVDFAQLVWAITPSLLIRLGFWGYATFARWRHRNAPETANAIEKFIARRTPEDLQAIGHRFKLIRENDPCPLTKRVETPVYQLTGFWDPVVNYPAVRRSLRKNCPGYRETHVIPSGDHNVLGTVPDEASEVVKSWISSSSREPPT